MLCEFFHLEASFDRLDVSGSDQTPTCYIIYIIQEYIRYRAEQSKSHVSKYESITDPTSWLLPAVPWSCLELWTRPNQRIKRMECVVAQLSAFKHPWIHSMKILIRTKMAAVSYSCASKISNPSGWARTMESEGVHYSSRANAPLAQVQSSKKKRLNKGQLLRVNIGSASALKTASWTSKLGNCLHWKSVEIVRACHDAAWKPAI